MTDVREVIARAVTSMKMLLQNAEGCASEHYPDCDGHLPGWLLDCRKDMEALAALADDKGEG